MSNELSITELSWRARWDRAYRLGSVCVLVAAWLVGSLPARTHETGAASFSIDLDQPYYQVVAAVEDVARSNIIKGTFEYKSDGELPGARFEDATHLFPAWTGPGKVFFKVRRKALSPAHFLNSNDVGTVAVRYVVQEQDSNSTRLFIDAVFVENAAHHGHPSDGYVETCEFAEIGKRLKQVNESRAKPASGQQFSPEHESSSRADDTSPSSDDPQTRDLQRVIAEQQAQLDAETANVSALEAQLRRMRSAEFVRVSAERAEMKVQPYAHSRVVAAVKKGQEVTILARSSYWYRVRSEDGQEGWISQREVKAQP